MTDMLYGDHVLYGYAPPPRWRRSFARRLYDALGLRSRIWTGEGPTGAVWFDGPSLSLYDEADR